MKTLTFAAGAAIGYVLGTKAGREKYQQIVDGARAVSHKPAVQQAQSKIKDLVGQGTTAVTAKLGSSGDDTASTPTSFTENTPASFGNGSTVTKTGTTRKKATAPTGGSLVDNDF